MLHTHSANSFYKEFSHSSLTWVAFPVTGMLHSHKTCAALINPYWYIVCNPYPQPTLRCALHGEASRGFITPERPIPALHYHTRQFPKHRRLIQLFTPDAGLAQSWRFQTLRQLPGIWRGLHLCRCPCHLNKWQSFC